MNEQQRNQTTPYQLVLEFMSKFGQEVPNRVKVPGVKILKLRASLILEEALETITAMGLDIIYKRYSNELILVNDAYSSFEFCEVDDVDVVEVLDGLVDLDVVGLQGTSVAFGFSESLIYEAQVEIAMSNMSKLWTREEKEEFCKTKQGHSGYTFTTKDDKYLVTNYQGKVIKSPSYSPADLKSILIKYGYEVNTNTK